MKNTVYAIVIVVCIVGAVVVFYARGRGKSDADRFPDSQTWVKCMKCNQSYEMSLKQFYKDLQEKRISASISPIAPNPPLKCEKCGADGIRRAYKCENPKCGDVFFASSVPNDFEDRCPKCKSSATEAKREANKARQS